MPVKPQPIKLTCRHCGNSMIFAPRSDAFTIQNCEKCGEGQWDRVALSTLDWLNPKVLLQSIFK